MLGSFEIAALIMEEMKQIEDKIKEHYVDMLRTYNANYLTLMTQEPFGANFCVTQSKLCATEHLIEWFEREFSEICHCEYDWHKGWKDENFEISNTTG